LLLICDLLFKSDTNTFLGQRASTCLTHPCRDPYVLCQIQLALALSLSHGPSCCPGVVCVWSTLWFSFHGHARLDRLRKALACFPKDYSFAWPILSFGPPNHPELTSIRRWALATWCWRVKLGLTMPPSSLVPASKEARERRLNKCVHTAAASSSRTCRL
jgi:hypothetical protein